MYNQAFEVFEGILSEYAAYADNKFFGDWTEWTFHVNEISESWLGYCNLRDKTIVISQTHFDNGDWEAVKNTIVHECAHALAGVEISPRGRRMVHGKRWKSWMKRLGGSTKAKTTVPSEHAHRMFASKKYLVLSVINNKVSVEYGCDRRLKNLESRGMSNSPHTFGNLYMIHSHDYNNHMENEQELIKRVFR